MQSLKTVLVLGASRGIGRQTALTLAENGYGVGVAAKTTDNSGKLPGTIYSVCEEVKAKGGKAIPIKCNVRVPAEIDAAVDECVKQFGHLDSVVYNAGAILWDPVVETPLKKYDLMTEVNIRGAYITIQKVLPYFLERGKGKILLHSPPIYSRFFKGKTPYAAGKVGMTVFTMGLAHELAGTGVSISSIWPATTIETQVTVMKNVPPGVMRKSTIVADATLAILDEPSEIYNGRALIDEELLRERGVTDFTKYRCDPETEPPRMMPKQFPSLRVAEEDEQLYKPKL